MNAVPRNTRNGALPPDDPSGAGPLTTWRMVKRLADDPGPGPRAQLGEDV
jgi:hypothetical protein